METTILPGGALLGPEIRPMTAEEEATARERVKETLKRIAPQPQPKQKLAPGIEQIAALLRAAPSAVRRAWILNKAYTRITFLPKGYTSMDSCGCCFTDHPPGWYLGKVSVYFFINRKCEEVFWAIICGPNGDPPGKTLDWDILDSH